MRVAMILSSGFYPDRRTFKETESLCSLGHDVVILAWDRQRELPKRERLACGATVERYQGQSSYGTGLVQIGAFARFWLWAIVRARRLRVSVVHCHDLDATPVGLALHLGDGSRFTYDPHEPSYARRAVAGDPPWVRAGKAITSWAIDLLERFVVRSATDTLATNPFHAGKYLSWGARNVVEVANYPPLSLADTVTTTSGPRSTVVFGTVGGLRPGTGLELLVDAARILSDMRRADIRIEISGFSTYRDYEQRLRARAGGLPNLVFDVENKPGSLAARLSRLDVVCVLYDADIENYRLNVATRLFDAMAVARPTLVTDAGYTAYLVRSLGLGYLLRDYTPHALAQAMCRIVDDRTSLPDIGRAAHAAFRAHYNWKISEAVLASIYAD